MKSVLVPLASVPGVRMAMLSLPDGVPIAWACGSRSHEAADEEPGALAALGAGWVAEIARAVAPLAWSTPGRIVLRASRGSIVLMEAPGALLLAVLEEGMAPEDVRIPMEAALARLSRGRRTPLRQTWSPGADKEQVPGIFPAPTPAPASGVNSVHATEAGARPSSG